MKLIEIAKKSNLTLNQLNLIAEEFNESIAGMTKNNAHKYLISTIENMMKYGDLYVYEGRFPTEEPEIVKMPKDELHIARCLARMRHEQLCCNRYPSFNDIELIPKGAFYLLAAEVYDYITKKVMKNNHFSKITIFCDIFDRCLIKGMSDEEYKEWQLFINFLKDIKRPT